VASVLHLRQPKADGNNPANATADWAKQHNDDLEDRAIGAAGNHGFYAKRTHDGGGDRGVKALFATDYRNLVLDLRDLSWQIATQ